MKKHLILLTSCILCTWPLCSIGAQEVSMGSFLSDVKRYIRDIERSGGTLVHIESDILFKGSTKSTYRALLDSKEYGVYVIGTPERIKDVDVKIYKSSPPPNRTRGALITKDEKTTYEAKVTFTPSATGFYEMEVNGYQFIGDNTVGHYAVIIYYN